jgi:hypothetical protein
MNFPVYTKQIGNVKRRTAQKVGEPSVTVRMGWVTLNRKE